MNKHAQTKNLTFALPGRYSDIDLESHFGSIPGLRAGRMSVTIPGRSFEIITTR